MRASAASSSAWLRGRPRPPRRRTPEHAPVSRPMEAPPAPAPSPQHRWGGGRAAPGSMWRTNNKGFGVMFALVSNLVQGPELSYLPEQTLHQTLYCSFSTWTLERPFRRPTCAGGKELGLGVPPWACSQGHVPASSFWADAAFLEARPRTTQHWRASLCAASYCSSISTCGTDAPWHISCGTLVMAY